MAIKYVIRYIFLERKKAFDSVKQFFLGYGNFPALFLLSYNYVNVENVLLFGECIEKVGDLV